MKDVYGTLYRIGSEKNPLPFDIRAAKASALSTPTEFDISKILYLENMEFIETLYMVAFNRTLDERARPNWLARKDWPKSDFQALAVREILGSREYANAYDYSRQKVVFRHNVYAAGLSSAVPSRLIVLRSKVLGKLKRVAKRILGR